MSISIGVADTGWARGERARRRREAAEQEYRDEVYRQWRAAEAATNGYMLNRAGQRGGIDERSLFTGPEARVRKYASPELIEWFASHPRPTRVSWFGSAPARRAHLAGRRIGGDGRGPGRRVWDGRGPGRRVWDGRRPERRIG